ncbi:DUF3829 domain-containing protein [Agrobacterium fabrum]|uniref:DUF3829 domain-containing protein n=1 Tax=Agrobacterium fabrum TaxID=1176649 RepID=UPI003B9FE0A6
MGIILLAIIFLAKGGDVPSLLRDLGLSHLLEGKAVFASRETLQNSEIAGGTIARTSKLASSIDCINRVDGPMKASVETYSRSFPAAFTGGPIIFRNFKIVPYEVDYQFTEACTLELREAANTPPANEPLDAAAMEYATALNNLIPVMRQVDDYLTQETYLDDDWRLMRDKLHPQITGLFDAFLPASYKLRREIDGANLTLTRERLAEIENSNGRDYSWHEINLIYQARLALNVIMKASDQNGLAVERIRSTEAVFEDALQSARTAKGKQYDARAPSGNKPLLFYLEPRAVTFLAALKTLRRNLIAGQRVKTEEDLQRITDAFNTMIRDYNGGSKSGL